MSDIKKMTDWEKLTAMLKDSHEEEKTRVIDEASLNLHLKARVKGQDQIVEDVSKLLRLRALVERRNKPICSMLFLGPTGTGKTELAKAIAEFLYGHEKNMLRFDCSELSSGGMGKSRLIGSAPGFVGSESGGQLTRPMFANPKRVVLFDEIEKADSSVFDLFLQMLGDGRLTEQSTGKTADFTESVIILTSNALAEEVSKSVQGVDDPHEKLNAMKTYLSDSKVFRPEILGRFDKIYLFNPLDGFTVAEVAIQKIAKLAGDYGLTIDFVAPELIMSALKSNEKISKFGIRELERIIFEMFADQMVVAKKNGQKKVKCEISEQGQVKIAG